MFFATLALVACSRPSSPDTSKIGKPSDPVVVEGQNEKDDPFAWARVRTKQLVASLAAGDALWTRVTPEPQEKIVTPCAAADFAKKDGVAQPSTHRKGEMFLTFVRNGAADPYRTHGPMPDGAALVKRTFLPKTKGADEGEITAYFLMFKAQGKNPDGGDWIWATTTGDGTPLEVGTMASCADCHRTQAPHDWVFGPK
jgi:hypothetical protein